MGGLVGGGVGVTGGVGFGVTGDRGLLGPDGCGGVGLGLGEVGSSLSCAGPVDLHHHHDGH
ncbi:hypothetical protein, partial [Streptomyces aureus]|uniref:hypothetical protein n=1 Tax=Streptomyces aureus TaxID=193461 RepID=UPI003F5416F2